VQVSGNPDVLDWWIVPYDCLDPDGNAIPPLFWSLILFHRKSSAFQDEANTEIQRFPGAFSRCKGDASFHGAMHDPDVDWRFDFLVRKALTRIMAAGIIPQSASQYRVPFHMTIG
jgi:hypothetical protein